MGHTGDALWPLQTLNAAFGAGTILILALIIRLVIDSAILSILLALCAAFSYAFWTHTVDAFFIIPAAFFSILCLLLALLLRDARLRTLRLLLSTSLGLSLGLAGLVYQADLALAPALMVASWPSGHQRARTFVRNWAVVFVVLTLVAGGMWTYQAVSSAGVANVQELSSWFLLKHGGMRDGLWRREGVNLAVTVPTAWLASILPVYEGLRLREAAYGVISLDRIPAQLALVILTVIMAHTIAIGLKHSAIILRDKGTQHVMLFCSLWFLIPGLTVAWFDPAEVKLWLVPMLSPWIAYAAVINCISRQRQFGQAIYHQSATLLLAFLITASIGNFVLAIWPDHVTESAGISVARQFVQQSHPHDLLIYATFDWPDYVEYVAGDRTAISLVGVAQSSGRDGVRPWLRETVEQTWRRGGRVYVPDYFGSNTRELWQNWISPFTGLDQADFQPYHRSVAMDLGKEVVWELAPLEH
jgi:hypothetical protein